MKGPLILKYGFPIIAVFMLAFALVSVFSYPKQEVPAPAVPPPASPYKSRVAGIGIIEPRSETIEIGAHIAGIVTQVHVRESERITAGAPLFTIDRRQTLADLALAKAKLQAAKVLQADLEDQLSRYERIPDKRIISQEELARRRFGAERGRAGVAVAQAEVASLETTLVRHTVAAPIDAEVLRINTRPGEFAPAGLSSQPLMILGDTSVMHVRVEIDETDVLRMTVQAPATGKLRGYADVSVSLLFVRRDPYILPKRSLTGDGNERVDTRVAQVIYAFDNKGLGAYTGQQMDVFIEAEPVGKAANTGKSELSP